VWQAESVVLIGQRKVLIDQADRHGAAMMDNPMPVQARLARMETGRGSS